MTIVNREIRYVGNSRHIEQNISDLMISCNFIEKGLTVTTSASMISWLSPVVPAFFMISSARSVAHRSLMFHPPSSCCDLFLIHQVAECQC